MSLIQLAPAGLTNVSPPGALGSDRWVPATDYSSSDSSGVMAKPGVEPGISSTSITSIADYKPSLQSKNDWIVGTPSEFFMNSERHFGAQDGSFISICNA